MTYKYDTMLYSLFFFKGYSFWTDLKMSTFTVKFLRKVSEEHLESVTILYKKTQKVKMRIYIMYVYKISQEVNARN